MCVRACGACVRCASGRQRMIAPQWPVRACRHGRRDRRREEIGSMPCQSLQRERACRGADPAPTPLSPPPLHPSAACFDNGVAAASIQQPTPHAGRIQSSSPQTHPPARPPAQPASQPASQPAQLSSVSPPSNPPSPPSPPTNRYTTQGNSNQIKRKDAWVSIYVCISRTTAVSETEPAG